MSAKNDPIVESVREQTLTNPKTGIAIVAIVIIVLVITTLAFFHWSSKPVQQDKHGANRVTERPSVRYQSQPKELEWRLVIAPVGEWSPKCHSLAGKNSQWYWAEGESKNPYWVIPDGDLGRKVLIEPGKPATVGSFCFVQFQSGGSSPVGLKFTNDAQN